MLGRNLSVLLLNIQFTGALVECDKISLPFGVGSFKTVLMPTLSFFFFFESGALVLTSCFVIVCNFLQALT